VLKTILTRMFGTKHDREMKRLRPRVVRMNEQETKLRGLTDEQLRAKTVGFRERFDRGEKLDDLLLDVFPVVREAGRRTLEMRHFDVQMVGGMVLHEGRIAEMKTGEGKTLVATLALVLNALTGKGAHLVTVNDYLASRDADWMGRIYRFLGLSVGVVVHGQSNPEKKRAYRCDITYGQNNEFGFDYLRDNMKYSIYDYVQRELNYAIVDEVDSILVDEARTPLIISGSSEESTDLYRTINGIVPFMKRDIHYVVDEKAHSATLTDEGVEVVERKLNIDNLFDPANIDFLHHVNTALKAHTLYKRDVNYMVTEEGEVIIIDEFTGRLMPGRRWSDGLHQAVEAKENVRVREENRTLATISFQNYFRLYNKLSGMTGTADTEAEEFNKIYKLDVVVIPTNKPLVRTDYQDVVFKTEREKFSAVVEEILDCHERGQPVLVGTSSVEKSEAISRILKKKAVEHNVLKDRKSVV
jgi:preprotein translocase subunit SecA